MFVVVQLGWLSSAIIKDANFFYDPMIKYLILFFWIIDFLWFLLIWILLAGILNNQPQLILIHLIYCIFLIALNTVALFFIVLDANNMAISLNIITLFILIMSGYHENVCYRLMKNDNYYL
ncbi:unnamed protein product [Bursaphelenchus xylophilus]|uniref:(pine wood nematode) hypothetical protein n=1 Tax=Bursaphelenchus xylophilus TaxID=6326 RepID=A0A1I7RQ85_BURXY|nr:unnamed protein product [Bursaphelenchus xylophilus]CAG9097310.1 unnamed protein product [Bursaphelenchus xylophilus]